MKRNADFDRFNETMKRLIAVPHSELKAKLDAEKAAKKRKSKRPSASRAAGASRRDSSR
jgi:hypothetical protein